MKLDMRWEIVRRSPKKSNLPPVNSKYISYYFLILWKLTSNCTHKKIDNFFWDDRLEKDSKKISPFADYETQTILVNRIKLKPQLNLRKPTNKSSSVLEGIKKSKFSYLWIKQKELKRKFSSNRWSGGDWVDENRISVTREKWLTNILVVCIWLRRSKGGSNKVGNKKNPT